MTEDLELVEEERMNEKERDPDYINLLNDWMFKSLFKSPEAREFSANFLSNITHYDKELFMNATYSGGDLTKRIQSEKGKTSDAIVKLKDHTTIIVEMNQMYSNTIFKKNSDYLYSYHIESMHIGAKNYPTTILININNFNKTKTKEPILEFHWKDQNGTPEEQENLIKFHVILENLKNARYNDNELLVKYGKFLTMHSLKEMRKFVEGDEVLMAAFRRVEELSTDPNFIGYYDYEESIRQDKEAIQETYLEEGKKEANLSTAKQMLKDGMDLEQISKYTSLSIHELETLKNC